MVDYQRGMEQCLSHGGLEDGAHVDRDEEHLSPSGCLTLGEPAGDGGDGTAFDLAEQPLIPGQVHEADKSPVACGRPGAGGLLRYPAGPTAAHLVNAQHDDRSGLGGQHPQSVLGERRRHDRPRETTTAYGLAPLASPSAHRHRRPGVIAASAGTVRGSAAPAR